MSQVSKLCPEEPYENLKLDFISKLLNLHHNRTRNMVRIIYVCFSLVPTQSTSTLQFQLAAEYEG